MSKIVDDYLSDIQIYEICNEFYKYEQHLLQNEKDIISKCYLIDSKSIENLKEQIHYDELKNDIANNKLKEDFVKKVKMLKVKIKKDLIPKIFKSSEELVKSLKNGEQYYFIAQSLGLKICKKKKLENSLLQCSFHKNKIKITFKDNSEIEILTDLSGLIKESLIILILIKNILFLKIKLNKYF